MNLAYDVSTKLETSVNLRWYHVHMGSVKSADSALANGN